MSKYYKIVTHDLKSVWIRIGYNAVGLDLSHLLTIVQYKVGEWVKPKISGTDLMVFNSINGVKHFIKQYSLFFNAKCKIYEVEVVNPRKKGLFISSGFHKIKDLLDLALLRLHKKEYLNKCTKNAPLGTRFTSAVKLIEEIKL